MTREIGPEEAQRRLLRAILSPPKHGEKTEAQLRHEAAVARLRALLPLWAELAREGHAPAGIDYGRTQVAGSAPSSRAPLASWALELSEALARIAPRWRKAIWQSYVVDQAGIETAEGARVTQVEIRAYDDLIDVLGWDRPPGDDDA